MASGSLDGGPPFCGLTERTLISAQTHQLWRTPITSGLPSSHANLVCGKSSAAFHPNLGIRIKARILGALEPKCDAVRKEDFARLLIQAASGAFPGVESRWRQAIRKMSPFVVEALLRRMHDMQNAAMPSECYDTSTRDRSPSVPRRVNRFARIVTDSSWITAPIDVGAAPLEYARSAGFNISVMELLLESWALVNRLSPLPGQLLFMLLLSFYSFGRRRLVLCCASTSGTGRDLSARPEGTLNPGARRGLRMAISATEVASRLGDMGVSIAR